MNRPSCVAPERSWPPRRGGQPQASISGFVQVTGALRDRATLRLSPRGGPAVLSFELESPKGWPYIVHQMIPPEAASLQAAEAKAHRLHAGVIVHVYAHGCQPRTDHSVAALWLLDVTDIVINTED